MSYAWQLITCPHCNAERHYDFNFGSSETEHFTCDHCEKSIYVSVSITKTEKREFKADWRRFNYQEWQELDKKYDHAAWDACIEHCTAPTLENWMEQMEEATKKAMAECGGRPPFAPHAFYNPEGDILEVYLSNQASYGKWLNPQITVLLAEESNEVVGFQIWGVKRVTDIMELAEKLKPKPEKSE